MLIAKLTVQLIYCMHFSVFFFFTLILPLAEEVKPKRLSSPLKKPFIYDELEEWKPPKRSGDSILRMSQDDEPVEEKIDVRVVETVDEQPILRRSPSEGSSTCSSYGSYRQGDEVMEEDVDAGVVQTADEEQMLRKCPSGGSSTSQSHGSDSELEVDDSDNDDELSAKDDDEDQPSDGKSRSSSSTSSTSEDEYIIQNESLPSETVSMPSIPEHGTSVPGDDKCGNDEEKVVGEEILEKGLVEISFKDQEVEKRGHSRSWSSQSDSSSDADFEPVVTDSERLVDDALEKHLDKLTPDHSSESSSSSSDENNKDEIDDSKSNKSSDSNDEDANENIEEDAVDARNVHACTSDTSLNKKSDDGADQKMQHPEQNQVPIVTEIYLEKDEPHLAPSGGSKTESDSDTGHKRELAQSPDISSDDEEYSDAKNQDSESPSVSSPTPSSDDECSSDVIELDRPILETSKARELGSSLSDDIVEAVPRVVTQTYLEWVSPNYPEQQCEIHINGGKKIDSSDSEKRKDEPAKVSSDSPSSESSSPSSLSSDDDSHKKN